MLKIVTIGTNFVLDMFMDGVPYAKGIEIYGCFSRDPDRAEQVAEKYGLAHTYSDMDVLAADPEVDALWIATPNIVHKQQAMKFLKAGKHVLLEKPAVTCLEDFEELLQCAKENHCILMEAMRPVHGPGLDTLRELMKKIGPIRRADFYGAKYSSRYTAFRNGDIQNAFNKKLQNSALMDMGCYATQLMVALFGLPVEIKSMGTELSNGFEGQGQMLLKYDGMIGSISYGKITDFHRPNEIQGEDGTICFDTVTTPQSVKLYLRETKEEFTYEWISGEHDFKNELTDFALAVKGELDVSIYHEYTRNMLKVMDECRRQNGSTFD